MNMRIKCLTARPMASMSLLCIPFAGAGASAFRAASEAVYQHGQAADVWPAGRALTASTLARHLGGG